MISFDGKSALVTGAASGIGRALARALAARGARLVLVDRDAAGLAETAAELGGGAITITADLSAAEGPARVIAEAFAAAGPIALVCSNAGITQSRKMIAEDLGAGAERMLAINFLSSLRFAQAYAAALDQAGTRGRLLITGSEQSLSLPMGVRELGFGMYGAAKHALLIAAEWMREEFPGAVPIDLHVLMPGPVPTNIAKNIEKPAGVTVSLDYISPDRCAEIALRGMDLGLFYIPTHASIAADLLPRYDGVLAAIRALELD